MILNHIGTQRKVERKLIVQGLPHLRGNGGWQIVAAEDMAADRE